MNPSPFTLLHLSESRIVLAPHRRYRGVVDIGNGHFFGRVVDRDRGNATIIEVDDVKLIFVLARLVAQGIGIGILESPRHVRRVGVRFDIESDTFGCFAIDPRSKMAIDPLVTVEPALCLATASLPRQPEWYNGITAEHAMISATSAFMAGRSAA